MEIMPQKCLHQLYNFHINIYIYIYIFPVFKVPLKYPIKEYMSEVIESFVLALTNFALMTLSLKLFNVVIPQHF